MRIIKIISGFFGALALCLAALALYMSFQYTDTAPMLLTPAQEARSCATALLDAVCQGDYNQAQSMLLGTPSLGVDRPAEEAVGVLIWDAFVDSLSYELVGSCYATDSGVAQDVRLTYLQVETVTASLHRRSQQLLTQRVETAADTSEVYTHTNEYREDVVMDVLYQAAQQSLEQEAKTTSTVFTINLVYRDGRWWVLPEPQLIGAISGGFAG